MIINEKILISFLDFLDSKGYPIRKDLIYMFLKVFRLNIESLEKIEDKSIDILRKTKNRVVYQKINIVINNLETIKKYKIYKASH